MDKRYFSGTAFRGRRQVARHKMMIRVEEVGGHPESQTSVIDISPQGAQLETDFSLGKGELIEFNLPTQESGIVPIFSGRVVWISKVSEEPERYRIGISFINPYRGLSRFLFGGGGPSKPLPGEGPRKSWWRRLLGL